MNPLEEWNTKDRKPNYYFKWWYWLFLWLLPTRITIDGDGILYTKHFKGHTFVMKWKRIHD